MSNLNEEYPTSDATLASTPSTTLTEEKPKAEPRPALSMIDAIAVIVGIVVGAGIFRTPSLVAANVESGTMFLSTWLLGGLVSLIGALCYAELTTTFPHAGGDYHFLTRAFGKRLAFLFAWARMSVIQTGSIALLSFIIGDYMAQIYSFGEFSSVLYAALVVVVLTAINIVGVSLGAGAQRFLLLLEVLGIGIVLVAAFLFTPTETAAAASNAATGNGTAMGLAMVFVLLTFGGWNEAAYISAELKTGRRGMATALIASIAIITLIYLLINLAYLHVLGMEGMASSNAIAADLAQVAIGDAGMVLIGIIVVLAALTSANATILTGARTNYALGRDFPVFSYLGQWNTKASAPVNAYIVQGIVSLALVGLALFTRNGFETMVEYTAPVFWFFLLLVGIALFVLRRKEPNKPRPFRVPLYPLTPLIFCFTSAYLFYSSLMYTGLGALVGIGVLVVGVLVLLAIPRMQKQKEQTA
ncbi:APC family permease [Pontibacter indicus]|uniref:Amino acid/polyamine/organocation transporter, APC superfamily n=1 Tax=Pontibacter indicus TaxID=1317125 RepID=A0A1R3WCJ8_9BACT|nr:amino acid permease [Pontibacter indicus]SIT75629.1 amino acid/polyamine/organocation transporter, APC superfamily [Pontibacter indicus]